MGQTICCDRRSAVNYVRLYLVPATRLLKMVHCSKLLALLSIFVGTLGTIHGCKARGRTDLRTEKGGTSSSSGLTGVQLVPEENYDSQDIEKYMALTDFLNSMNQDRNWAETTGGPIQFTQAITLKYIARENLETPEETRGQVTWTLSSTFSAQAKILAVFSEAFRLGLWKNEQSRATGIFEKYQMSAGSHKYNVMIANLNLAEKPSPGDPSPFGVTIDDRPIEALVSIANLSAPKSNATAGPWLSQGGLFLRRDPLSNRLDAGFLGIWLDRDLSISDQLSQELLESIVPIGVMDPLMKDQFIAVTKAQNYFIATDTTVSKVGGLSNQSLKITGPKTAKPNQNPATNLSKKSTVPLWNFKAYGQGYEYRISAIYKIVAQNEGRSAYKIKEFQVFRTPTEGATKLEQYYMQFSDLDRTFDGRREKIKTSSGRSTLAFDRDVQTGICHVELTVPKTYLIYLETDLHLNKEINCKIASDNASGGGS
jgi:hypothetical protein